MVGGDIYCVLDVFEVKKGNQKEVEK